MLKGYSIACHPRGKGAGLTALQYLPRIFPGAQNKSDSKNTKRNWKIIPTKTLVLSPGTSWFQNQHTNTSPQVNKVKQTLNLRSTAKERTKPEELCVPVYLPIHMCASGHMKARGTRNKYHLFCFLRHSLSLAWNSLTRLGWPVRSPRDPPFSTAPVLRLQVHSVIPGFWSCREQIKTQGERKILFWDETICKTWKTYTDTHTHTQNFLATKNIQTGI